MAHLHKCPDSTYTCSKKDLAQANQRAINVAQYWGKDSVTHFSLEKVILLVHCGIIDFFKIFSSLKTIPEKPKRNLGKNGKMYGKRV